MVVQLLSNRGSRNCKDRPAVPETISESGSEEGRTPEEEDWRGKCSAGDFTDQGEGSYVSCVWSNQIEDSHEN